MGVGVNLAGSLVVFGVFILQVPMCSDFSSASSVPALDLKFPLALLRGLYIVVLSAVMVALEYSCCDNQCRIQSVFLAVNVTFIYLQ